MEADGSRVVALSPSSSEPCLVQVQPATQPSPQSLGMESIPKAAGAGPTHQVLVSVSPPPASDVMPAVAATPFTSRGSSLCAEEIGLRSTTQFSIRLTTGINQRSRLSRAQDLGSGEQWANTTVVPYSGGAFGTPSASSASSTTSAMDGQAERAEAETSSAAIIGSGFGLFPESKAITSPQVSAAPAQVKAKNVMRPDFTHGKSSIQEKTNVKRLGSRSAAILSGVLGDERLHTATLASAAQLTERCDSGLLLAQDVLRDRKTSSESDAGVAIVGADLQAMHCPSCQHEFAFHSGAVLSTCCFHSFHACVLAAHHWVACPLCQAEVFTPNPAAESSLASPLLLFPQAPADQASHVTSTTSPPAESCLLTSRSGPLFSPFRSLAMSVSTVDRLSGPDSKRSRPSSPSRTACSTRNVPLFDERSASASDAATDLTPQPPARAVISPKARALGSALSVLLPRPSAAPIAGPDTRVGQSRSSSVREHSAHSASLPEPLAAPTVTGALATIGEQSRLVAWPTEVKALSAHTDTVKPDRVPRKIDALEPCEVLAPGYRTHSNFNLGAYMSQTMQRPIDTSLSRPSPRHSFCVIGSDNVAGEDSIDHFLMCVDWTSPKRDITSLALCEPVHDVHWIADDLVIAATGKGGIRIVQMFPNHEMVEQAHFTHLHNAAIRQLAPNKSRIGQFASGGCDKRVCVVDVNKHSQQPLQSVDVGANVCSVMFSHGNFVSCTLEIGTYLVYDIRQGLQQAVFRAAMGKSDLQAHAWYAEQNVIMGFGDGELHHIDMRVTNRVLCKVQDPFVTSVRSIDYNAMAGAFVVSGQTDATVWKHHESGQARVWSHMDSHLPKLSTNCKAVFATPESVLVATSGHLEVYSHAFDDDKVDV